MRGILFFPILAILVCGCEARQDRNTPTQQAEDYKICTDAGMRPYQNMVAEIMCTVPRSEP